ncbi:MAG: hypothetical protein JNJ85_07030 [Candidatus Kapabacteria bacterium]|nr:hypothetical protein [Candidatus Kapabacteria bacterium]
MKKNFLNKRTIFILFSIGFIIILIMILQKELFVEKITKFERTKRKFLVYNTKEFEVFKGVRIWSRHYNHDNNQWISRSIFVLDGFTFDAIPLKVPFTPEQDSSIDSIVKAYALWSHTDYSLALNNVNNYLFKLKSAYDKLQYCCVDGITDTTVVEILTRDDEEFSTVYVTLGGYDSAKHSDYISRSIQRSTLIKENIYVSN